MYVSFQESDSPPSSNVAIHLHPLTLASVHSVIQMATDLRATHPAGFIHNTPQVNVYIFFLMNCRIKHEPWRTFVISGSVFQTWKNSWQNSHCIFFFSLFFLGPVVPRRKPNHPLPLWLPFLPRESTFNQCCAQSHGTSCTSLPTHQLHKPSPQPPPPTSPSSGRRAAWPCLHLEIQFPWFTWAKQIWL